MRVLTRIFIIDEIHSQEWFVRSCNLFHSVIELRFFKFIFQKMQLNGSEFLSETIHNFKTS